MVTVLLTAPGDTGSPVPSGLPTDPTSTDSTSTPPTPTDTVTATTTTTATTTATATVTAPPSGPTDVNVNADQFGALIIGVGLILFVLAVTMVNNWRRG